MKLNSNNNSTENFEKLAALTFQYELLIFAILIILKQLMYLNMK